MKKKIFIILITVVLLISIAIVYVNNVILPVKIKSLIIRNLQEQTQKKVTLESVQFNIFKGLVLRGLNIYDDKTTILSLKEGSCTFLILPIFRKSIIFPAIKLKSLEIFLERRADNTFNLQDLFIRKTAPVQNQDFNILAFKINIINASIHFQDDTLPKPFTKIIEHLNLILHLSLPASVRFSLQSEIPANPAIKINAVGEYKIPKKELSSKVAIKDFSPSEFLAYYQDTGISIAGGTVDALINLRLKDDILNVELSSQNKNLNFSKDKVLGKLNSAVAANLQYGIKDKKINFSGKANIIDSSVSGLDFIAGINGISGEVTFNNAGLFSDKLSALALGVPVQAKISLNDFNNPILNINIASSLELNSVQKIIKDRFNFTLPADIQGKSNLSVSIQAKAPFKQNLEIRGYLDILNARAKLEKINPPLEKINGKLEFSQNQLKWAKLNFEYLGIPYKTSGILTNFQAPGVQLELSSQEISLESIFSVQNKLITLSKLTGRYLNSDFTLAGKIDTAGLPKLTTDISGTLNIDLKDSGGIFKKFKNKLEQIKPSGIMQVNFNLNGNINDFKSCDIEAKFSGSPVSIYGLQADELLMTYNQAAGIADIPLIHLALYGGTVEASAKMNLASDNLPYWITANMQGVKIEKLKLDTAAKGKDIAGTLQAQVKLNGFSNDLSRLSGAGEIFITEGKLWQLNLFQGLGSLLFARDFANIIFNEGYCAFTVKDKYIFTDSLKLKSNITDLSGQVKIGFDSSIDASLNVQVLDEMAPITGTLKDIATAIIGKAGRFGVIKITGTLKEPRYKFQPAVADIIKGLKDSIFGQ